MAEKLKVLDLFSGIGGFSLGLERAGMETVAFCEIEPFCVKVLNKHWPDVPVFNDVRSLDYDGRVDVISGGYPCQPFSVAGKQKGKEDDRHLWPAMFSLIKKHRPTWVIGENVAGHINLGLDDVLADLEREAYTVRTFVIPACAVNAPHRRDRVWIVAHACGGRLQGGVEGLQAAHEQRHGSEALFARKVRGCWDRNGLPTPRITRGDDGVSDRMDRINSLGNAVVPQIPEIIGRAIMEIENGY